MTMLPLSKRRKFSSDSKCSLSSIADKLEMKYDTDKLEMKYDAGCF